MTTGIVIYWEICVIYYWVVSFTDDTKNVRTVLFLLKLLDLNLLSLCATFLFFSFQTRQGCKWSIKIILFCFYYENSAVRCGNMSVEHREMKHVQNCWILSFLKENGRTNNEIYLKRTVNFFFIEFELPARKECSDNYPLICIGSSYRWTYTKFIILFRNIFQINNFISKLSNKKHYDLLSMSNQVNGMHNVCTLGYPCPLIGTS